MIWVGGRIVPDDALKISALDRTFEHGLGLFETLRTWDGHPRLLARHLSRLTLSATSLGLPFVPTDLPNSDAVLGLLRADGFGGDRMIRITLTGGHSVTDDSTLWMRAAPLPPAVREPGARIFLGGWEVVRNEPLASHKTLNYWSKRRALDLVREHGYDEAISTSHGTHCFWEGARTNLFVVIRDTLITPSLAGPLLPGVMRALVLELAREKGWSVAEESDVSRAMLCQADEVFLTNAVRGIIPVASASGDGWPGKGPWTWAAPGPWTERLTALVNDWLIPGGNPA